MEQQVAQQQHAQQDVQQGQQGQQHHAAPQHQEPVSSALTAEPNAAAAACGIPVLASEDGMQPSSAPTLPIQHVQGMNSLEILDQLTGYPTSYLLSTQVPAYRSHAAHQQGAALGWHNTLSPMVFHTEAGVVLYDRVVTSTQEGTLVDKLCKPKNGRPPNSCVSKVAYSGGAGAPTWAQSPHISPQCSPYSSPHRPQRHMGVTSLQNAPHRTVTCQGTSADDACRPTLHTVECSSVAAGNRGVANGAGMASRRQSSVTGQQTCDRIVQRQRQRQQREEAAEVAAKQHYFQQQRATMTATQVFTWGGRLSHRAMKHAQHDRSNGSSAARATISAVTGLFTGGSHRAPQRLDAYQED